LTIEGSSCILYRAITKAKGIMKINILTRRMKLDEECLLIFKNPYNEEIARCKCPSRNG